MNMNLLSRFADLFGFGSPPPPPQQQQQQQRQLKRRSPRLVKTKPDSSSHTPPVQTRRSSRIKKTVRFKKSPKKETTPEDITTQINHIKSIQNKIYDKFDSDRSSRLSQAKRTHLVNTLPDRTVVNCIGFITKKEFNMLHDLCNHLDLNKNFNNDQGVKDLIEKIQSKKTSVCLEDLSKLVNQLFQDLNFEKLTKS